MILHAGMKRGEVAIWKVKRERKNYLNAGQARVGHKAADTAESSQPGMSFCLLGRSM